MISPREDPYGRRKAEEGGSAVSVIAQIERVIYNFIDNAVNHTDESKRIKASLMSVDGSARFEATD